MTARRNFETLNLLRGLAALTVLAWYFHPVDQRPYWSAYLSVDLFFVLSGVVVAHAYEARLRGGWRVWRFAVARVIRLWPLYLLGSALGLGADAASALSYGVEPWRFKLLLLDGVRAAFLVPRFADGVAFPLDPPGWSLFCEFAINILYGAILVRWRSRWLLVVAIVGAVAMTIGSIDLADVDVGLNLGGLSQHLGVGFARALFSFPVGVLIHRGWRAGKLPRLSAPPVMLCGLFFVMLFVVPGEGRWAVPARLAAIVVGFPLLVVAAVQVEPQGHLAKVAQVTADLSYPIYAIHDALYLVAGAAVVALHAPVIPSYLGALAATLILAPIADRWGDRPVRRFLTRIAEMPRGAVTSAAPL